MSIWFKLILLKALCKTQRSHKIPETPIRYKAKGVEMEVEGVEAEGFEGAEMVGIMEEGHSVSYVVRLATQCANAITDLTLSSRIQTEWLHNSHPLHLLPSINPNLEPTWLHHPL